MAKKVVTEVKTMLEQADIDAITRHIGEGIMYEISDAKANATEGKWDSISCGLADAYDWANILGEVRSGEIKDLETLVERVGRLDTAAREIWWEVLNPIYAEAQ